MATSTWLPSGGDFNVASNWTLDGVTASTAPSAATGTGSLQISCGGIAKLATTNPHLLVSLAVGRSGTGTVTVDGTGSQLQLTGILYAGRRTTSNATVTLTNGASLTETAVGVGFATRFGSGGPVNGVFMPTGPGTFNVLSDSTATFGDSLNFGDDGVTGVGLVSKGTVNVGDLVRVGSSTPVGGGFTAPGGKGALTINDGGIVRDTAAADSSTAADDGFLRVSWRSPDPSPNQSPFRAPGPSGRRPGRRAAVMLHVRHDFR